MTKWHRRALGIALIAVAAALAPSACAEQWASGQLKLVIRPQVSLEQAGGNAVHLQIRLAREATASIWATDDSCSAPSPTARTISRSGTYDISTAGLGSGNNVCLSSSDGSLKASTRLQ